jgi:3-oxoacyl-[acyl-carrier-protein] synthase-3
VRPGHSNNKEEKMSIRVGLEAVAQDIQGDIVTPKDQEYLLPTVPEFLRATFQFPKEIRRFRNEDAAEILAENVSRKVLDQAGLKPSDIDYIISNNCGGKYTVPMVGSYIHWKLGFPIEVPVLNISNACASFVDGCEVAWNLIKAGKYKRILVVMVSAWETIGGQCRTDLTNAQAAMMGDGAGAAIVSTENLKCEFLSHYNRTWPETYDMCGGKPKTPDIPDLPGAPKQPPFTVYMYGTPEFFMWWQKVGERFAIDGINGALAKANLTLKDLDVVIFHQPADLLYDVWMWGAEKEGVSKDKWIHTWHKYGNLSNAVVPVNLAEFWAAGKFRKDMIQTWITIGAGGHAPTMVVKWLV